MKAQQQETWAAAIEDKPGGLAASLAVLTQAGANLEFILARRAPERAGCGVVFVAPLKGAKQARAAAAAGFNKTASLHTVRIESADKPGLGARVTRALADHGLNLRGLSAAAIGRKFVGYVALDTAADVTRALRVLRRL